MAWADTFVCVRCIVPSVSDAPDWDGNQEPRLLTRESQEGLAVPPETIQTFAWSDEDGKIKCVGALRVAVVCRRIDLCTLTLI